MNKIEQLNKKSDIRKKRVRFPVDYWFPRDFEIVQPLYDLAFLLEISSISKKEKIPEYRILSLYRAAHKLDSYTSSICKWLDGILGDNNMGNRPSNRIRQYLEYIRNTGTLENLQYLLFSDNAPCLRLRSLRGLSIKYIAKAYSLKNLPDQLLQLFSQRSDLCKDDVIACFKGTAYGKWQAPHIIPPILRFLKTFELNLGKRFKWEIFGIKNGIEPISEQPSVTVDIRDKKDFSSFIDAALSKEPFFSLKSEENNMIVVKHQMGWSFSISVENTKKGKSLFTLIRQFDPIMKKLPTSVRSDLHIHTYWSDGLASPQAMEKVAKSIGLDYIAITDHSRSSRLQRGLSVSDWLHQSLSLRHSKIHYNILHGIEVDILKDGSLDMPKNMLKATDIVMGSIHSVWSEHLQENTARLIRAIESGHIDILGHPTSALVGKPGIPNYERNAAKVDWDTVFRHCAMWRVALEVNCFPSRLDLSSDLVRRAVHAGCWIALGSDAHAEQHLNVLKLGVEVIRDIDQCRLLNALSFSGIKEWLHNAREFRTSQKKTKCQLTEVKLPLIWKKDTHCKKKLRVSFQGSSVLPCGVSVVGIDLSSAKGKKTGVAFLNEYNSVETASILTDENIISYVKEHNPRIVSIDSPLGLPGGEREIKPEAGIMRVAEYDLASVGIPAYPALIDSMKKLTLRGICIRRLLESLSNSPKVIESYPGAAQDIMNIPRKQRGLHLLREGLKRIGVTGSGLLTDSHDELDAITSAIVGRFYEMDLYEMMGIPSEAQLIVPKVSPLSFNRLTVICLAGKTGAGKSVISRYLSLFYGFHWIRTADIIKQLLIEDFDSITSKKLGLRISGSSRITSSHLRNFGQIILEQYGQKPLKEKLGIILMNTYHPVVIDAIRSLSDVKNEWLRHREKIIWFVDTPDSLIRRRAEKMKDGREKDTKLYKIIDQNMGKIYRSADKIIPNAESLEKLRWRIDDALFESMEVINDNETRKKR